MTHDNTSLTISGYVITAHDDGSLTLERHWSDDNPTARWTDSEFTQQIPATVVTDAAAQFGLPTGAAFLVALSRRETKQQRETQSDVLAYLQAHGDQPYTWTSTNWND